jgi:hypothetical protein
LLEVAFATLLAGTLVIFANFPDDIFFGVVVFMENLLYLPPAPLTNELVIFLVPAFLRRAGFASL